jgi:hypothetical protein
MKTKEGASPSPKQKPELTQSDRKQNRRIKGALVGSMAAAVVLTGCAASPDDGPSNPSTTSASAPAAPSPTEVTHDNNKPETLVEMNNVAISETQELASSLLDLAASLPEENAQSAPTGEGSGVLQFANVSVVSEGGETTDYMLYVQQSDPALGADISNITSISMEVTHSAPDTTADPTSFPASPFSLSVYHDTLTGSMQLDMNGADSSGTWSISDDFSGVGAMDESAHRFASVDEVEAAFERAEDVVNAAKQGQQLATVTAPF